MSESHPPDEMDECRECDRDWLRDCPWLDAPVDDGEGENGGSANETPRPSECADRRDCTPDDLLVERLGWWCEGDSDTSRDELGDSGARDDEGEMVSGGLGDAGNEPGKAIEPGLCGQERSASALGRRELAEEDAKRRPWRARLADTLRTRCPRGPPAAVRARTSFDARHDPAGAAPAVVYPSAAFSAR